MNNLLMNKTSNIGKFTIPISFPTKEGFSINNKIYNHFKESYSSRVMGVSETENSSKSIVGKEVLCLTKFLTLGPQLSNKCLDSSKKP